MLFLKLVFVFVFFLDVFGNDTKELKCKLKRKFSKVCHVYDFLSTDAIENGCHPTRLSACKLIKIKKNDPKCEFFECTVSSLILVIF